MIKIFEKLIEQVEVQITLSKAVEQENGMKARIVLIPLTKEVKYPLVPIEVWGSAEDVENSIKYTLQQIIYGNIKKVKNEDPGIAYAKATIDKLIGKSGIPKDNIAIVKMKPHMFPESVNEVNENKLSQQENQLRNAMIKEDEKVERCSKCEIPLSEDLSNCIYDDCPEREFKAPKDADNYMVEEELKFNMTAPKEEKFVPPDIHSEQEADWAIAKREEIDQRRNESDNEFKLF